MFKQIFDPVNHSLGESSLFAVLPLLVLFLLLGVFNVRAHWAAIAAQATSIAVADLVYSQPFGQAADSAFEGAVFGLFPIMWIVVNAIWIYTMTVKTGHFDVLRRSFARVSDDHRVQAIIIAFCFGALQHGAGRLRGNRGANHHARHRVRPAGACCGLHGRAPDASAGNLRSPGSRLHRWRSARLA